MLTALTHLAPLLLLQGVPASVPTRLVASDAEWNASDDNPFTAIIESYREDVANQVRIEQRIHIHISPKPGRMPAELQIDETRTISTPRYVEAKAGKCISANAFAAMRAGAGRRLFLFTRDNRIFSALLERGCQGKDYYLGFHLAASADAKLCVERDRLFSRAGANCRLKQIRELIEVGD